MHTRLMTLSATLLSVIAAAFFAVPHAVAEPQKVAFFGFRMINDSLEKMSDAERNRLQLVDGILIEKLEETGRYKIVKPTEEMAARIAKGPNIGECNGCELDYGRELDADLMAWGTVQKVSNLILNLNVYMGDTKTEQMTYIKSVDIRGNDDVSWTKGLGWLLKHYMPGDDAKAATKK